MKVDNMATVRKLPGGKWNAQVRIKGHPAASASFPSKVLADKWVKVIESEMVRHTYIDRTEGEATTLGEAGLEVDPISRTPYCSCRRSPK